MTQSRDIPPQDGEVIEVLHERGSMSAGDLVHALVSMGHPRRDAQRSIQRCLDRGSVRLGEDLELIASEPALAHAA